MYAKKALGQHFLIDKNYCRKIAEYAAIQEADVVVEIGPGMGHLTEILLERARRVVAIEFDRDMVHSLEKRFAGQLNEKLFLIRNDILQYDWKTLPVPGTFKLVGNLPYNISTRILRKSIEVKDRMASFVFMVQKEVAERIMASPGDKDYGYFTVLMQYHFERHPGFDVPPGAFAPRPKVLSHVMMLTPRLVPEPVPDLERFDQLLSRAFAHPRKTLWNNLSSGRYSPEQLRTGFEAAALDLKVRPHQVSLGEYACLARVL